MSNRHVAVNPNEYRKITSHGFQSTFDIEFLRAESTKFACNSQHRIDN